MPMEGGELHWKICEVVLVESTRYGKAAIAALEMTVEPLMHVEAPLNWMRSRNGNADLGAEKNSMCARQDSQ